MAGGRGPALACPPMPEHGDGRRAGKAKSAKQQRKIQNKNSKRF